MAISEKMKAFADRSSWIRKMFEEGAKLKAQYGAENVYDFSIGNPDLDPPPEFEEVLQKVAGDNTKGIHGYMPNGGYPWVRDIIATKISEEQDMMITGADMIMTCGAAGALNVTLKSLLNPGDEVILLAPYFVDYGFYIDNHGGVAKIVNTDNTFNIDFNAIEEAITEKTKAIIVNSPHNPTGVIYPEEDMMALGKLLKKMGDKYNTVIYLIADEPYRKIVFSGYTVPSVLQSTPNSIVVSSYSKSLSLPGERMGYIAVHPDIYKKAHLLNAMTMANRILGFINAPALMQRTIAELQDAAVDYRIYEKRYQLFKEILTDAGYSFVEPRGSFYLFPKSPIDDVKFCAMLQENRILAVPGRGFGTPGHFRLAFCVDEKVIERSAEGFKQTMLTASRG